MVESDDEYAPGISDDEVEAHNVTRGSRGGRKVKSGASTSQAFEVRRTWDDVEEGADGTINQAIEGSRDAEKRKR